MPSNQDAEAQTMTVPVIKFWYSPGACSFAAHVLLYEIGARFDAIEVSVANGATQTAEFARINPKMRVPVLSLDGDVITEIPAVATAIANMAPELSLMGRTALDRVRAYEWMNWLSGTLHGQGFGGLRRPQRFSDDPNVFESIRSKSRATISDCFNIIEYKLSGLYSTGDGFSAVDPFLLVFYRWGNNIEIDMKAFRRYTSIVEQLVRRRSVIAALAAERIDITSFGL